MKYINTSEGLHVFYGGKSLFIEEVSPLYAVLKLSAEQDIEGPFNIYLDTDLFCKQNDLPIGPPPCVVSYLVKGLPIAPLVTFYYKARLNPVLQLDGLFEYLKSDFCLSNQGRLILSVPNTSDIKSGQYQSRINSRRSLSFRVKSALPNDYLVEVDPKFLGSTSLSDYWPGYFCRYLTEVKDLQAQVQYLSFEPVPQLNHQLAANWCTYLDLPSPGAMT